MVDGKMSEDQDATLFRRRSVSAARHRLLGQVCISTPPSTGAALLIALISMIILAVVVFAVEVPQQTRAVGVLMPAGGLLNVIASDAGQITQVAVNEGMTVEQGQLLLRISSDRNAPDRIPASESQIRSLNAELVLMERAHNRDQGIKARRASGLKQQIVLTNGRMAKAKVEADLQSSHVRLLEQRLERMSVLAANGSVAEDSLGRERSGVLNAKAAGVSLERRMLQIRQEIRSLKTERQEIIDAEGLEQLRHDMARQRLLRQISKAEIEAGLAVLAPAAGVVARLRVRPGSTCRSGETLMTLYKGDGRLEALQLRLDAYPHEMFGTLTAVVTKISKIALLASDLSVPLPIRGPVFEVRASISADSIDALGSSWPLAPGTSFKADVMRQKHRLYQWLLRSVWSDDEDTHSIAGP
jgi:membrane fusion protein